MIDGVGKKLFQDRLGAKFGHFAELIGELAKWREQLR